jgi:hypothetical protein
VGTKEKILNSADMIPTEEKARLYDLAIERARRICKTEDLEEIFPELRESEDEKIRDFLIDFIKVCGWSEKQFPPREDCIAWLERQGGQKPSDKPEPRFKVGDWVTNNIETVQIAGYDIDYGYQVDYKGNLQHRDTDIIKKEYHLWTILDAKDGDVLYCKKRNIDDHEIIMMYSGINERNHLDSYCRYSYELGFNTYITNVLDAERDFITPANEEQREFLFRKMKEAGCVWNSEKKEISRM